MSTQDILSSADEHMGKAIARLHKDLATIRTGRPNAAILDRVSVDYYGTETPLKGLANISTPDGKSLVIQPYDKSALKAIETPSTNPTSVSPPTQTKISSVSTSRR
jgi:ribosome recycling factor